MHFLIKQPFLLIFFYLFASNAFSADGALYRDSNTAWGACLQRVQQLQGETGISNPRCVSNNSGDFRHWYVAYECYLVGCDNQNPTYTESFAYAYPASHHKYYSSESAAYSACESDLQNAANNDYELGDSGYLCDREESLSNNEGAWDYTVGSYGLIDGASSFFISNLYLWPREIPNDAPVVSMSSPINNQRLELNTAYTFRATASDDQDGNLTSSIRWYVNNLHVRTGGSVTRTFTSEGNYSVRAQVTDSKGLSDSEARTVRVVDSTLCTDSQVLKNGVCVEISSNSDIEDPNDGDPECNGIGNPVNVATGNKFQREVDFVALGESPLSYSRSYNSRTGKWVVDPRSHLESQFVHSDTGSSLVRKRVDWIKNDGKRIYFYSPDISDRNDDELGGSIYQSAAEGMKLTQLTNLVSDPKYYELRSGSKIYLFDVDGILQSVEFKSGVRHFAGGLTHTYEENGNVLTVSHSNGSHIELTFNAEGEIEKLVDTLANEYFYEYTNGLITKIFYPDEGSDNDYLNNPFKTYVYSGDLLTQIIDEESNIYRVWSYDSHGRVDNSGGSELMTNNYDFDYFSDRTEVTKNRVKEQLISSFDIVESNTSIYRFETINGEKKIVSIDGQPSSTCGATSASTTYDSNGFVDIKTDWDGDRTDYDYNDFGQLEAITRGYGTDTTRTMSYIWSPSYFGLLEKVTTPLSETTISYEDLGSNTFTETYTVTDNSNLDISVIGYNLPSGLAAINTQGTPAASRQITYEFYSDTNVLKTKSEKMFLPGTVGYLADEIEPHRVEKYNTDGQLEELVINGIDVTKYEYNPDDRYNYPQASIDTNDVRTEYLYKARGWLDLTTIIAPAGSSMGNSITDIDYYDNGLVQRIIYPNQYQESILYNQEYQETDRENSIGESQTNTRMSTYGWTTKKIGSSPNTRIYTRSFDVHGEVILNRTVVDRSRTTEYSLYQSSRDVDKTDKQFRFREMSGRTGTVDTSGPLGADDRETTYYYDELDQLDSIRNAKGKVFDYSYNDHGMLTSVTDPRGLANTKVYDGLNRLRRTTISVAGALTKTFWYNPLGNLKYEQRGTGSKDNQSGGVQYEYSHGFGDKNLALLTKESHTSGEVIDYHYDDRSGDHSFAKGRLYRIKGKKFQTDYDYDHLGNIVRETKVINGASFITLYEYNEASELVEMTYPSGRVVTYGNEQGRVVSLSSETNSGTVNLMTGIGYEPFSQTMNYAEFGSGMTLNTHYFENGNILVKTLKDDDKGTALQDILYGQSRYGLIDEITRLDSDPKFVPSASYTYDQLNQLTGYSTDSVEFTYQYDDSNNRKERTKYENNALVYRHFNMHEETDGSEQLLNGGTFDPTNIMIGTYYLDSSGIIVNSGEGTGEYDAELWGGGYGGQAKKLLEGITYRFDVHQRIYEVDDVDLQSSSDQ